MHHRWIVLAATLVLVVTSVQGIAQGPTVEEPYVTTVAAGDADANRATKTAGVNLRFVDADGDGTLDVTNPDETAYIDLDDSSTVSFGDHRLTRFLTYPGGTAVNYTNRDVGLLLSDVDGWFARTSQGAWYVDVDGDGEVDPGDLRVQPGDGVEKVPPGDAAVGTSIERVQDQITHARRTTYADEGPSGLDWQDAIYLDLNDDRQATPGELRFQATHLGIDDSPTGREFQDAVDRLEANDEQLRSELTQNDQQMQSRIDALEQRLEQTRDELSTMDNWLLALGLFDLVAVAGVGWWVYRD